MTKTDMPPHVKLGIVLAVAIGALHGLAGILQDMVMDRGEHETWFVTRRWERAAKKAHR